MSHHESMITGEQSVTSGEQSMLSNEQSMMPMTGHGDMARVRHPDMTWLEIFELHPKPAGGDRETLVRCIQNCLDCAASCTSCADACLSESDLQKLVRCIRLSLDCAEACNATTPILIRQTAPDLRLLRATVEACATACLVCAEECERHADHLEHCRLCGEVCLRCKQACDDVLAILG